LTLQRGNPQDFVGAGRKKDRDENGHNAPVPNGYLGIWPDFGSGL
jgi:hypothetical protein